MPVNAETLRVLAADFNKASKELCEAQNDYAELDGVKKIVFAKVVSTKEGSHADKERQAYVDPTWGDWNNKYIEAEKKLNTARFNFNKAEKNWETCRSYLTYMRDELKTLSSNT